MRRISYITPFLFTFFLSGCPYDGPIVIWSVSGGVTDLSVTIPGNGESRSWLITAVGNRAAFDNDEYSSRVHCDFVFENLRNEKEINVNLSVAAQDNPDNPLQTVINHLEAFQKGDTPDRWASVEVYKVWPEGCKGQGECTTVSLVLTASTDVPDSIQGKLSVSATIENDNREEMAPEEATITVTVEEIIK
jgi:hypothetical protein